MQRVTKQERVPDISRTIANPLDSGKTEEVTATDRNIAGKQDPEQALQEREEQLRAILNTAVDAIITIDQYGIINGVNPSTERIFGYTEAELVNQNVKVLMAKPYRDEHDSYIARYRETGNAHIIGVGRELTGRRKDGSVFPVDVTVSEAGHLGLFTGVIRDISDRKELQKQVLKIAEEEDRRIGQEIHDGIQQQLTGLKMFAGTMGTLLDSAQPQTIDEKQIKIFEQDLYLKLCDTADTLYRGLSETQTHVQQLSYGIMPVQVDAQGLNAALTRFACATDALQGFSCTFDSLEIVEVSDNTVATHLYRIAQEAVNNALRHSNGDKILISLIRQQDQLILEIHDNGVGIQPSIARCLDSTGSKGLGLHTLQYRAGLIGATLKIGRKDHGGTLVRCTMHRFPIESVC